MIFSWRPQLSSVRGLSAVALLAVDLAEDLEAALASGIRSYWIVGGVAVVVSWR